MVASFVQESRGNINDCFDRASSVIYVTSYHANWYFDMLDSNEQFNNNFRDTIFEKFPFNNLVIYHEDDVPEVKDACMFDLRQIEWLEYELQNEKSGLNRYYEIAKFIDPIFESKKGDVKIGHALFMKVLSIYHAVISSPIGSLVLWVDTDVTFRENLPRHLIDWILKRDVVYIPFVTNSLFMSHNMPENSFDLFNNSVSGQLQALQAEWWRIDSGLFAVTVSKKTIKFVTMAVDLYRGGMYELAKRCFDKDPYCINNERIKGNVFLNDVFVFSMLLQGDAHKDEAFHLDLKHGWFAMRGLEPYGPWRAVWGNNLYYPNFYPVDTDDNLKSNFHIGQYIFHHFGYHEKGALSIELKNRSHKHIQRPSWKSINIDNDRKSSLYYFLQPYRIDYVIRFSFEGVDMSVTFCVGQRAEDAISDFSIRKLLDSRDLMDYLCDNLRTSSAKYQCLNRTTSPIIRHNVTVAFNKLNPHVFAVRENYSNEFFAQCACAHASSCSDETYQTILEYVTSLTSAYSRLHKSEDKLDL